MSDRDLSIDEIIKRAEQIKAQAEQHLAQAQKSLDEMAKTAIDEVTVDAEAVMQKVEQLSAQEEDVKTFTSSQKSSEKTQTVRLTLPKIDRTKSFSTIKKAFKNESNEENDDDMKIVKDNENDDDMKIVREKSDDTVLFPNDKTKPVILSSSKEDDPDSLQEVPTIISRNELKNYLNGEPSQNTDFEAEIGVQISFDGFDDEVEEVPSIDEEIAEQILIEHRREKVDKFRLFGPDETDVKLGDKEFQSSDYKNENQQGIILSSLFAKKSKAQIQIITTIITGVLMLLMTLFRDSEYFPLFLAPTEVFLATNLALLVLTMLVNYNIFIHAFNFKKGLNCDLPVAILNICILAQTIGFLANNNLWLDNGSFMGIVSAFTLFASQLGKLQIVVRVIDNFDFIISEGDKYCLENIANKIDSQIISRGILDDENPIIKTSVKTDFPTNFMEISCKTEPSNRLVRILAPISWIISAIVLAFVGLTQGINAGINAAICALAVSTPATLLFMMNSLLTDLSEQLEKYSSRVCGFDGVNMAIATDAMVLEASSLFGKQSCDIYGIKVFNNTKVDDAIIYAAAVITQTKSPLASAFDDVIIGKQSILPKVEKITYEESMGTSAWVYGRKVLVGNRNLLIRHGVEVPTETFEKQHTTKNRKALYLAVNGKIMAMFVVSYSADPDLKRELKKLEKSGITLIVKSCDPNINEESLTKLFALPKGFIRVMNYSASRVYEKYSDMTVQKSPCYIIHDGSAKSFIGAVRGAFSTSSCKKLIYFLTSFGSALGIFAVVLMCILGGFNQLTSTACTVFLSIWNLFVYIISKIQKLGF